MSNRPFTGNQLLSHELVLLTLVCLQKWCELYNFWSFTYNCLCG